jgi:hypothetical protein
VLYLHVCLADVVNLVVRVKTLLGLV